MRSSLRHYIGAPKPSCANSDADQIRSANYETDLNSRIFSCSGRISFTLRTFGAQINWRVISRKVLFDPHRHFFKQIALERAEKEIRFSMANGTFKMKMDIDCHGPRLVPNNCTNLNPPYFSLLSTFKIVSKF